MDKLNELVANIGDILDVILIIVSLVISIISIIYKIKSNFSVKITQFIKDAEAENLTNPEKMDLVISWIKNLIPRIFKVAFSDAVLKEIAENIYKDMKDYREIYINNKTGLATSQVIQIVKEKTEAIEESIVIPPEDTTT